MLWNIEILKMSQVSRSFLLLFALICFVPGPGIDPIFVSETIFDKLDTMTQGLTYQNLSPLHSSTFLKVSTPRLSYLQGQSPLSLICWIILSNLELSGIKIQELQSQQIRLEDSYLKDQQS